MWFGEVEALPGVAAQGLQLLTLCAGLDAFGDDVQAQSVGQPDHCVTMAWLSWRSRVELPCGVLIQGAHPGVGDALPLMAHSPAECARLDSKNSVAMCQSTTMLALV